MLIMNKYDTQIYFLTVLDILRISGEHGLAAVNFKTFEHLKQSINTSLTKKLA